ncbi:MAG: YbhB/YbcL family Raf kinase inhibitor-like protein [Tateyamaria sp.]|uniref:YbhB/YbcL family Raf kinase inhibitor-like protein n=1 Tax=Tateyamaria sp. TaxID=1929288 RepID=UPI00328FB38D
MNRFWAICATASACASLATASAAQDVFTLSSPEIVNGGTLPAALTCTRDGGYGVSPPLTWSGVPDGTESFAVIMHHYPRGAVAGRDAPSQYWLLWNIPADTRELERANPTSIGDEGADKDERHTGYTPPCSPSGSAHEYTITVFALDAPLSRLPQYDDTSVDWKVLTAALADKVIASAHISFEN